MLQVLKKRPQRGDEQFRPSRAEIASMTLNKRRHVGRAKLREIQTALLEPLGEELINER
jgi:hypothetical protein